MMPTRYHFRFRAAPGIWGNEVTSLNKCRRYQPGESGDREARAAAAAFIGVGILKGEARTVEAAGIIEGEPFDEKIAFGIHENFDAVLFKNFVVGAWLFLEIELIGHSAASSAHDSDTQATLGLAFLLSELFDLLYRVFGKIDQGNLLQPFIMLNN